MRLQDSTTLTVRLKLAMIEDGIEEFSSGPNADPQFLEDIDAYRFRDACRAELARREQLRSTERRTLSPDQARRRSMDP